VTGRKLSTVSKILSYQILIILIITAGFAFAGGWQQGLSSALGGMAAFVPNLYFACGYTDPPVNQRERL
jgi:ATP synthase protein I